MQAVEEKTRKKEAPSGIDVPWISNYLVPGKGERGWEEKKRYRGDGGGIRGLLPSSNTVLLLSRDVTAMSFGDQSMCVSRRFCAAQKISESDSVARHSSVAIKQGEIYGGRKLAFSASKRIPNGT